ncbi:hypothetical protein N7478_003868 [Penicillium angulare]|uniref:uncharacterized protein n=1 Tax=Penicillium angulare TaxID=116970 RepID=UPI0025418F60|nr:uncharacterized protein N7478_003868 [Penicillium angulare]KAJ5288182.1 hypothetical protein N7478_003868 [Penicillium angulare]
MFHKFSARPKKASRQAKDFGPTGLPSNKNNDGNVEQTGAFMTKRHKVAKACDRCRLQRIKCDETKPCARCVGSEVECTVSYGSTRSFQANTSTVNRPERESPLLSPDPPINPGKDGGHLEIKIPNRNARQEYLDHAAHVLGFFHSGQSDSSHNPAARSCLFPQLPHPAVPAEHPLASNELLKSQRSYYIRLFWDLCHPILQIMTEADISELEALPQPTIFDEYSAKNALVDSMIALGIQHSHATGLSQRILGFRQQSQTSSSSKTTWPGFEYFHRSRECMRASSEITIDALRCHILMVLYFMKGNAFCDAYNLIGITIRKAYIANFHRPPPASLSENEKTARMQLWWLLFSLDIQCSLQLGVPAAIQESLVKCPLPADDSLAHQSIAPGDRDGCINGYIYSTSVAKLAAILSDISSASISTSDLVNEDNSSAALEYHAATLKCALKDIGLWRHQLPPGILPRKYGNNPENTELLDFDRVMALPTSLQRQTVLLELQYHNVYTLIQRPFVRLCNLYPNTISKAITQSDSPQPYVDLQVSSAIHHAIMVIETIFTVCSTSDVLYGWSEVLQPLWNATLTIIAYIYAKSLDFVEPPVLDSLAHAQTILKAFSPTCPTAFCAKGIVGSLAYSMHSMIALGSGKTVNYDEIGGYPFAALSRRQVSSVGLESASSPTTSSPTMGSSSQMSIPDLNWMTVQFDES